MEVKYEIECIALVLTSSNIHLNVFFVIRRSFLVLSNFSEA